MGSWQAVPQVKSPVPPQAVPQVAWQVLQVPPQLLPQVPPQVLPHVLQVPPQLLAQVSQVPLQEKLTERQAQL